MSQQQSFFCADHNPVCADHNRATVARRSLVQTWFDIAPYTGQERAFRPGVTRKAPDGHPATIRVKYIDNPTG
jgi:hypothetical protein